ncbi:MAG: hypothetical protein H8E90_04490 [Anaerolineales bacterium]|nr:hypothetical protein [Anaerolineales bacterium]
MSLDKIIWREAIAQYRAWNDAKFVEQVLSAGQKSPAEKWREYQALMSLCWKLKPEQSPWEQRRIAEEWEVYYASMRRFEEWRRGRGKGIAATTE